jgi:hypothetical protein
MSLKRPKNGTWSAKITEIGCIRVMRELTLVVRGDSTGEYVRVCMHVYDVCMCMCICVCMYWVIRELTLVVRGTYVCLSVCM